MPADWSEKAESISTCRSRKGRFDVAVTVPVLPTSETGTRIRHRERFEPHAERRPERGRSAHAWEQSQPPGGIREAGIIRYEVCF